MSIARVTVNSTKAPENSAYDHVFWLTYFANALNMIAISMLFRYADFVTHLGGAEGQLGLIVGVGMVGSLAMRVSQGIGIDRYGPRRIWLLSQAVLSITLVSHLFVTSVSGPAIFFLRICMQTSIAGVFGASITYISRTVPPRRMAEIIGTLGTSGFIGILIGPQLSDWVLSGAEISRTALDRLFLSSATLVLIALFAARVATQREAAPSPRRHVKAVALVRRYNPGVLLLVAISVGAAMCVSNAFLKIYAQQLAIPRIGSFFAAYAIAAFAIRMATRRQFARTGNRLWIFLGLTALASSILLNLTVRSSAGLIVPGIAAGAAHALLFPAIVAGGSTSFPERHRGLGTTLMLAMFDFGGLIGAPMIGGYLQLARNAGLPAFPSMFLVVAGSLGLVCFIYLVFGSGSTDRVSSIYQQRSRRNKADLPVPPIPTAAGDQFRSSDSDYASTSCR